MIAYNERKRQQNELNKDKRRKIKINKSVDIRSAYNIE